MASRSDLDFNNTKIKEGSWFFCGQVLCRFQASVIVTGMMTIKLTGPSLIPHSVASKCIILAVKRRKILLRRKNSLDLAEQVLRFPG